MSEKGRPPSHNSKDAKAKQMAEFLTILRYSWRRFEWTGRAFYNRIIRMRREIKMGLGLGAFHLWRPNSRGEEFM